MKKGFFIVFGSILILLIIAAITLYMYIETDLSELDGRGEPLQATASPGGEYSATPFLIDDGGATVGAQIRVSITSKDGSFNDATIYWDLYSKTANIEWVNENELLINGIKINLLDEKTYYNWKDHV
jgi:Family of unknown function (DUF5412)